MTERAIGGQDRMGSPPTVRLTSAVLVATRVPKAELEEPVFGALPEDAWQGEEQGLRRRIRPPAASYAVMAKGELGSPCGPVRAVSGNGLRSAEPTPGGREDQRDC